MNSSLVVVHAQRLLYLLLRYIVAGGAAILAFGALQPVPFNFLRLAGAAEVSGWLLLLGVAVIGPALYSVHKAFLHPPIHLFVLWLIIRKKRLVGHRALPLDDRMDRAMQIWRDRNNTWLIFYDPWAAQIHFLYCSCWGIAIALIVHHLLQTSIPPRGVMTAIVLLTALFISAAISDFRLCMQQVDRTLLETDGYLVRADARKRERSVRNGVAVQAVSRAPLNKALDPKVGRRVELKVG